MSRWVNFLPFHVIVREIMPNIRLVLPPLELSCRLGNPQNLYLVPSCRLHNWASRIRSVLWECPPFVISHRFRQFPEMDLGQKYWCHFLDWPRPFTLLVNGWLWDVTLTEWMDDSGTFIAHYQWPIFILVLKTKTLVANCVIKNHHLITSFEKWFWKYRQISGADPRFPSAVPTLREDANLLFSQIFLKIEWKCRKLGREGEARPIFVYVDPPMNLTFDLCPYTSKSNYLICLNNK